MSSNNIALSHITWKRRGYARLAAAMAWDPGMSSFPRFRKANALNLICLQSEICQLEVDLEEAMAEDDASDGEEKHYTSDINLLKKMGSHSRQWQLFLELRSKLHEYNQAIVMQAFLNEQISPTEFNHAQLQMWLQSPRGGASVLRGAGAQTWMPPEDGGCTAQDLLLLNGKSAGKDWRRKYLSEIITLFARAFPFVKLEHRTLLPEEGLDDWRAYGTAESFIRLGDRVATVMAPVLILVPVIVLHFVTNKTWRLIIVVLCTLLFSVATVSFTEAKRSEVFAAVAAFAAVQVVYIGSVT